MQISTKTISDKAIEHDTASLTWFNYWTENGERENDIYYKMWQEHRAKSDAMVELLNMAEPFYTHYVFDGKIVKELIP